MISKELLNEVLNIEVAYLEYIDRSKNIEFRESQGLLKKINIYELAHICKEWASKLGFHLTSHTISYEAVLSKGYCQTHHVHHIDRESDKPFRGLTEPEAIFEACQWILENKDMK